MESVMEIKYDVVFALRGYPTTILKGTSEPNNMQTKWTKQKYNMKQNKIEGMFRDDWTEGSIIGDMLR